MNEEIDGYDEIVKEFLAECTEHLDTLDNGFVVIEQNSSDRKTLAEIFRSIHTIKGGAGMLAFQKLEKVTHAAESLLSLLRDGKLELNSQIITTLLRSVDVVREMLNIISVTSFDGDDEHEELIADLLRLQTPQPAEQPKQSKSRKSKQSRQPQKPEQSTIPAQNIHVESIEDETASEAEQEPEIQLSYGAEPENKDFIETQSTETHEEYPKMDIPSLSVNSGAESEQSSDMKNTAVIDATIRINVDLLDKLMNLVGELVLSRNQILQFISAISDSSFIAVSQRLNLITSELQEGVMKTRMQPIGNVWSKFTRIVRDLATTCNKRVNLVMYGKETELDKTLIEAIKDPLTHIVRNSVDHGIELPEKRRLAGKPEEGTITLKAYHEGGHVNIEIHDDGGGLSAEKIKGKALEKGLISADQAARMSERDALNLVFLPGFSTAEKVTNISGRGVGMDVVRTNIERINGTIELQSKLGWSTTIKIKIPLTLAIIPALIITCQGNRYAIPQISLLELVRLEPDEIDNNIQYIKDDPVYKLRGKLLPLVYLNKELELAGGVVGRNNESINIVVLQAGETEFGLVVDSITDTQEIVVKPLSKLLRNQQVFAGATIMGDGKISLILDAVGIARKAGLLSTSMDANKINRKNEDQENKLEKQTLLLLSAGTANPMGVPLEKVDRIEEFSTETIELIGAQEVVQYRDSIMPLVRLNKFMRANGSMVIDDKKVQVIVHSNGSHNYGLVVDRVYDIVEGAFRFDKDIRRPGVIGASVIEDKITEILDIEAIMRDVLPAYYQQSAKVQS
ncbi:chemotaxis protein CheA [Legionella dresdenensis]|uniref:histidine kinase n=1 Tax=Legionella dresdenensis TaxID=450200 RepID=A0ABV8CHT1_9GAMM